MPRQARIVIPNTAHHIIQRGNYRQKVFDKQEHYLKYCQWIDEYVREKKLQILAYCLMSNHVHFIVMPKDEKDLSEVFKIVHMKYAHYINRQRSVRGHLWQGRFNSCVLDEAHLYGAVRYVENNPVRAKIVKEAWSYNWSSAKDHMKQRDKPLIKLSGHKQIKEPEQWQEYLEENDPQLTEDIRIKTERGLVVGSDKFIKKIEGRLSRSLECVKQGRPKKNG